MVSQGPKRGWATPRIVSFWGLIHNFLRASPPISYGSLPPGIDQPGGQDGWILAEFFDLFYQIYLFLYLILYLCLFLWTVHKTTTIFSPFDRTKVKDL